MPPRKTSYETKNYTFFIFLPAELVPRCACFTEQRHRVREGPVCPGDTDKNTAARQKPQGGGRVEPTPLLPQQELAFRVLSGAEGGVPCTGTRGCPGESWPGTEPSWH